MINLKTHTSTREALQSSLIYISLNVPHYENLRPFGLSFSGVTHFLSHSKHSKNCIKHTHTHTDFESLKNVRQETNKLTNNI